MTELTLVACEQLIEELTEIAEKAKEENGGEDFIYSPPAESRAQCLNVHNAEDGTLVSGCLIGRWAHEKRGVPLERLAEFPTVTAVKLAELIPEMGLQGEVAQLARHIQRHQDADSSWLEAIRLGIEDFAVSLNP